MGFLNRLKRLPKAGQVFVSSLAEGVQEEASRTGSAGQRFSDAPLGAYFLPGRAQDILGYVAPSPRKVVRDTKGVIQNPTSVGNWAAEANNIVSIATLPALVTGGRAAASGLMRGGRVFAETGGLPLAERVGLAARSAATKGLLYHGTTQDAAEAIRRVGFAGEQAFTTTSPRIAARYAKTATALQRLEGTAARPAVVAVKASPGAQAVSEASRGALGVERAYAASDLRPIQIPAVSRIKQRVQAGIEAARAESARPAELAQKIASVKQELASMGNVPEGKVVSLPFRGTTEQKIQQVQAELERLKNLRERFPSTLREKASKAVQSLQSERGAVGKGKLPIDQIKAQVRQDWRHLRTSYSDASPELLQDLAADTPRGLRGSITGQGRVQSYINMSIHAARREQKLRQILRKAGINPDEVFAFGNRLEREGQVLRPAVQPTDWPFVREGTLQDRSKSVNKTMSMLRVVRERARPRVGKN